MQTEKMSLAAISDFLTRDELKAIMAGSGDGGGGDPNPCYPQNKYTCTIQHPGGRSFTGIGCGISAYDAVSRASIANPGSHITCS